MNQSQIPEMVELLSLMDEIPPSLSRRDRARRLLLELAHSPAPPATTAPSTKEEPSAADSALREAVMEMVATTATTPLLQRLVGVLRKDELSHVARSSMCMALLEDFASRVLMLVPDADPLISTSASQGSNSSAETSAEDAATSSSPSSEWQDGYQHGRADGAAAGVEANRPMLDAAADRLRDALQSRDEWRQRALGDEDRITALEAQIAELSPVKPADIAEAFANARAAEEELDEDEEDGVLSVDVQVHEPLIDERPPFYDAEAEAHEADLTAIGLGPEPSPENLTESPETDALLNTPSELSFEPTPGIDIPVIAKECNCSQEHWQKTRRFTARERNEGHELSCPMYLKGAHFFPLAAAYETDGSGVYNPTCAWCGETKEMRPYGEDAGSAYENNAKRALQARRDSLVFPTEHTDEAMAEARKVKKCIDCGVGTIGTGPRCKPCSNRQRAALRKQEQEAAVAGALS